MIRQYFFRCTAGRKIFDGLEDWINKLQEALENPDTNAVDFVEQFKLNLYSKEIFVFVERLKKQKNLLKTIPFSAKFGGATGNFNAHYVAYPEIDWIGFGDHLINQVLGLERSKVTTQIEHYDNLAAFCDNLKRINTIFIDLNRDIWSYISMNYFKQKIKDDEVVNCPTGNWSESC